MFFTDIDREAGEATRKQFLAEFGEARAEFSVQDVTDSGILTFSGGMMIPFFYLLLNLP